VKRETTLLIALALLMNTAPAALAQSAEINDSDLQSLVESEKSSKPSISEEDIGDLESVDTSTAVADPAAASEPVAPSETAAIETTEPVVPEVTEKAPTETGTETATTEGATDELDELKTDLNDSEELEEFKPAKSDSPIDTAEAEKKPKV
jgi:hypothetical protein